jgi:hypothetical protein
MKYAVEVRPRTQPRRALPEAGVAVAAAVCVFVIVSSVGCRLVADLPE